MMEKLWLVVNGDAIPADSDTQNSKKSPCGSQCHKRKKWHYFTYTADSKLPVKYSSKYKQNYSDNR